MSQIRKNIFFIVALAALSCAPIAAQLAVTGDLTGAYTIGIAAEDQKVATGYAAMYDDTQNGSYTAGNLNVSFKPAYHTDLNVKLKALARTGSDYLALESPSSSAQSLALSVDSFYGKINALDSLYVDSPVDVFVKMGKYNAAAAGYHSTSRYGTENAVSMIKTGTNLNLGLELRQMRLPAWRSHALSAEFATNALFNEAVTVLYDTDGSMSAHGKEVLNEYSPQFFGALRLDQFRWYGLWSLEADYAMNANAMYTGHSAGLSGKYSRNLIPNALTLQVGFSGAYYEKNLDALSAVTGTGLSSDTTDLRDTYKAGAAVGFRYVSFYRSSLDLNLAGGFARVGHIYRDPLDLFSASVDGKFTWRAKYFIGGGVVAGSLLDAEWATSEGVSSLYDDYAKTFTLIENLGYEGYAGVNLGDRFSLVAGYNLNKGLSMNYAIEAIKDGQIKSRQSGTTSDEGLFQTGGVYIKSVVKF